MPFVNVQTIKGIMTEAQKSQLLDKITDLMVQIEGRGNPAFRQDVWVRIDEHEPESWSLGDRKPTRAYIEQVFGKNR